MGVLLSEMIYGLEQMIQSLGDTVVLVNRTTLTGPNPAPNPFTLVGTLNLSSAYLAGGSSVSMAASQILTGRVVPGDSFTIAGDPTTYTVSGQIISPTTSQSLTAVPFAPVLQQDEPNGAEVTFTFSAYSPAFKALVTDIPGYLINGTTVTEKDHRVRFTTQDIPVGVAPQIGMLILLQGGTEPAEIVRVSHLEVQGQHYGWACQVRS
ncbi:MAG: hypothetical protein KGL39_03275 [Patescibacteria group bacterium]|nr:hypothetical protein [Patescibacteria group bacterium]